MADKTVKEFVRELEDMGLRVEAGNHNKVYTDDGRWVMDFSSSPSDQHWRKSATRRLVERLGALYENSC